MGSWLGKVSTDSSSAVICFQTLQRDIPLPLPLKLMIIDGECPLIINLTAYQNWCFDLFISLVSFEILLYQAAILFRMDLAFLKLVDALARTRRRSQSGIELCRETAACMQLPVHDWGNRIGAGVFHCTHSSVNESQSSPPPPRHHKHTHIPLPVHSNLLSRDCQLIWIGGFCKVTIRYVKP